MCPVSLHKESESTKGRARDLVKAKEGKVILTKLKLGYKTKTLNSYPFKNSTHLKLRHHQKFCLRICLW